MRPFFSTDPRLANLQFCLSQLKFPVYMYVRIRPNSSLIARPYAVTLLPHEILQKIPNFIKLFCGLFSPTLHQNDFHFSALATLSSWNAFRGCISFSPIIFLLFETTCSPYESLYLISLCRCISERLDFQLSFLFQVWLNLQTNQDFRDSSVETFRPLSR